MGGTKVDADLQSRVKSIRKAYVVLICMFFWGIGCNLVQNYFESQASMMKEPFEGWDSRCQLMLDGLPQIFIAPMIYYGKKALEERGYNVSHQRIIFSGILVSVLSLAFSVFLQWLILSRKENPINMFVQIPIWVLNAYVESTVYAFGFDFSFSVAHPSMKSLILSIFYAAIGVGNLVAGALFQIFSKHMEFKVENNSMYQSVVFLAINVVNALIFFFFADWTPVESKLEKEKSQRISMASIEFDAFTTEAKVEGKESSQINV